MGVYTVVLLVQTEGAWKKIYRVAQKECNTFDHQFQRNQGLNQISECSNE